MDYKDSKNANEARSNLQGFNIRGHRINIEWSKNSGRQEETANAPDRFNNNRDSRDNRDSRGFRPNPSDKFSKIFDYKPRRRFPEYDQKFDYSYELSDFEDTEELIDHPQVDNILEGLLTEKRVKLV